MWLHLVIRFREINMLMEYSLEQILWEESGARMARGFPSLWISSAGIGGISSLEKSWSLSLQLEKTPINSGISLHGGMINLQFCLSLMKVLLLWRDYSHFLGLAQIKHLGLGSSMSWLGRLNTKKKVDSPQKLVFQWQTLLSQPQQLEEEFNPESNIWILSHVLRSVPTHLEKTSQNIDWQRI